MGAGRWICVICGKRMGPYRCLFCGRRVCLNCKCDCPRSQFATARILGPTPPLPAEPGVKDGRVTSRREGQP